MLIARRIEEAVLSSGYANSVEAHECLSGPLNRYLAVDELSNVYNTNHDVLLCLKDYKLKESLFPLSSL